MNVENLRIQRGVELKKLRKSKGITQEGIAKLIGVSLATIIRMERGKKNWGIDWELRFRHTLSTMPDKLDQNRIRLSRQLLQK
jgi:transcriptional regulator with XRE-family HTH domain